MANKILECKSRELRGSQLYTYCDCKRRNGLQNDCMRRDCILNDQKTCTIRPYPKCCASLFANRFENVSMGKPSYPEGTRLIRVFDSGSCVNQYDPKDDDKATINPPNPCGPKHDCNINATDRNIYATDRNINGTDCNINTTYQADIDPRSTCDQLKICRSETLTQI